MNDENPYKSPAAEQLESEKPKGVAPIRGQTPQGNRNVVGAFIASLVCVLTQIVSCCFAGAEPEAYLGLACPLLLMWTLPPLYTVIHAIFAIARHEQPFWLIVVSLILALWPFVAFVVVGMLSEGRWQQ